MAKKRLDELGEPMPKLNGLEMAKIQRGYTPYTDIFSVYTFGKLIGQGCLSVGVHKCTNVITGDVYAVKILDMELLKPWERDVYNKEVSIMKMLDHPNIIAYENHFITPSRFFIVMEKASGMEIFHQLNQKKKNGIETRYRFTGK